MVENQCQCVVPLAEVVGDMSPAQAAEWARRENVELRSTWDRRLALSTDDARVLHDKATAAAEAARRRNQEKLNEVARHALDGVSKGLPVRDGLSAYETMISADGDATLERLDRLRQGSYGGTFGGS